VPILALAGLVQVGDVNHRHGAGQPGMVAAH